jgi:hypothetical protein
MIKLLEAEMIMVDEESIATLQELENVKEYFDIIKIIGSGKPSCIQPQRDCSPCVW